MGRVEDKDVSPPERPAEDDGRPGRVEFDSRGNSVWRWARDVLDSTSILLKRLENKDLALEPTQKVPVLRGAGAAAAAAQSKMKPGGPAKPGGSAKPGARKSPHRQELDLADSPRKAGGGFDPYNSR